MSEDASHEQYELYHSRRYWIALTAAAVLVPVGITLIAAGFFRGVGWSLLGAGLLALFRLIFDRWAVARHKSTSADWRPPRRTYVVPVALVILGVLLVSLTPGHTSRLIGIGVGLISVSVPIAVIIAVRRSVNDPTDDWPSDS